MRVGNNWRYVSIRNMIHKDGAFNRSSDHQLGNYRLGYWKRCENYEEKDLFVYIPACDPWSEGAPLHSCQLSAPKVESTTCRKCRTNLERQQFQRKLYFKHYLNYAITLPGSNMRNSKPWLNHVLGSTCESWNLVSVIFEGSTRFPRREGNHRRCNWSGFKWTTW